nr:putative pentatricopeptide repeat-containing protein At3g15930 [Ipomoea batatas]
MRLGESCMSIITLVQSFTLEKAHERGRHSIFREDFTSTVTSIHESVAFCALNVRFAQENLGKGVLAKELGAILSPSICNSNLTFENEAQKKTNARFQVCLLLLDVVGVDVCVEPELKLLRRHESEELQWENFSNFSVPLRVSAVSDSLQSALTGSPELPLSAQLLTPLAEWPQQQSSVCQKKNKFEESRRLFVEMEEKRIMPSAVTLISLLSTFSELKDLEAGRRVLCTPVCELKDCNVIESDLLILNNALIDIVVNFAPSQLHEMAMGIERRRQRIREMDVGHHNFPADFSTTNEQGLSPPRLAARTLACLGGESTSSITTTKGICVVFSAINNSTAFSAFSTYS